jgi:ABC-2 type transport system ATP-binding protein
LDHPTIVVLDEPLGVPPSGDFAIPISLLGATEKITLSRDDNKGLVFYRYCHELNHRNPGPKRRRGRVVNVIETHALAKSYGQKRALHDCTLTIPEGHIVALVGPNGAGKTTFLNLVVGLAVPTSGAVTVLGGRPAGSLAALDGIAFVAQNTPLYKNLSARDLLHETRNLNRRFDQDYAERRLDELGIPLRQKAGEMSGGQQAQLALTLALARLPQLLVLDEPLANLDPIAREDFMATVMRAATEDGVSVLLSSHVLAELERVADYLVLVTHGDIQLAGEVEDLLATHRMLSGPAADSERLGQQWDVVHANRSANQGLLLVRGDGTNNPVPAGWEERAVTLEELTMAYLREAGAVTSSRPTGGFGDESSEVTK